MRNFTLISSKIISTNCKTSLYGVYVMGMCHRESTTEKSKNKGKIIVIKFRCCTMILGASEISFRIAPTYSFWIW